MIWKNQKIIIFDTAGRHKKEKDLLDEIEKLSSVIDPSEAILVIDATIGQQAAEQAKAFTNITNLGSIIITKLDGSAKGGGALSAVAKIGVPIKFIGTGEKLDDFEVFNPKSFISRLLGMGDIRGLIEKAKEAIDENIAVETMNVMLTGKFTIKDMENQFAMMNKMGPMKQIMNMIPGINGKISKENLQMTEYKINKFKTIMSSMSNYEKENPKIIKQSRVLRISKGAGVKSEEVKDLIKYYNTTKKGMKGFGKRSMGGGSMARIMNQFMK